MDDTTEPPAWMGPSVASVWRELAPETAKRGRLKPSNTASFAALCDAIARHREASSMVERDGMLIVGAKEQVVPNPAVALVRQYAETIAKLERMF